MVLLFKYQMTFFFFLFLHERVMRERNFQFDRIAETKLDFNREIL